MPSPLPKLRRDVQFVTAMAEGRQVLVAQDPLGLMKEPVILTQIGAMLVSLLNQVNSLEEVQIALTRAQGGILVPMEQITRLISVLDRKLLLDSAHYRTVYTRLIEEFEQTPVRPASCAGSSYPADREELTRLLDAILRRGEETQPRGQPLAIVSPHIEIRVGQAAYAQAYRLLEKSVRLEQVYPTLIVVLGVGHTMNGGVFCTTDKNFETPLGTIKTARERIARLRHCAPKGSVFSVNALPHKQEHSIEFQLVFLQHVLKGIDFHLVPILCGSLHDQLGMHNRAADLVAVRPVFDELRRWLQEESGQTLLVAGVDFSHVGPKFGDPKPATVITPASEYHDRKLLDALCARDARMFWATNKAVEDRYHVCGFSALSCLLEILPPCQGRLLHYEIWHEPPTQSAVSFAAVVFEGKKGVNR